MKTPLTLMALAMASSVAQAALVNSNDPAVVAAFQRGLTIETFDNVATRTAQAITAYTSGDAVAPGATIFDEVPGVQFSVGGTVGTNRPALYQLSGGIAGDAQSGNTVLGPVDFEFNTLFGPGAMLEVYLPTKVSKLGFWINPALGNVRLIALNTNFAFSGLEETVLEVGDGQAGMFAGIERDTADIGGFKILGLGNRGFTIDDFSFGGTPTSVPEPGTWALLAAGLAALGAAGRRTRRRP